MKSLTTTMLADNFNFLEGPRWRDGKLWLSDMQGRTIYTLTEDGAREEILKVEAMPSGLGFLPDGSLLIVSMEDEKLLKLSNGQVSDVADLSPFVTGHPNDMVVDKQGRAYIGNFGYDLLGGAEAKNANIVMISPDGSAKVVADDLVFPNGAAITPDGKTFVVAETFAHRLAAFDIAEDGSLSGRRTFGELPEAGPDGICMDADGAVWVSGFLAGKFFRVEDGGKITHEVDVGSKCAVACQLGGADGKTLFCLTFAGSMEEIAQGNMFAAVETVKVDSAAAGSP
jgi:sugar lactone lactonase YvrE